MLSKENIMDAQLKSEAEGQKWKNKNLDIYVKSLIHSDTSVPIIASSIIFCYFESFCNEKLFVICLE
jgi:hypothetical protein